LPAAQPLAASKANRTIVGMPGAALAAALPKAMPERAPPAGAEGGQAPGAPANPARPMPAGRTIVGMAAGALGNDRGAAPAADPAGPGPMPVPLAGPAKMQAASTLLGVARPGIAPLAPGEAGEDEDPAAEGGGPPPEDPPGYQAARELGATMGPAAMD